MKLKPKVKQFNDILQVHRNFQQVLNGITKQDFQCNTTQGFGVLTTQRAEIHPGLCKT
jgi:uncharacterized protein YjbK